MPLIRVKEMKVAKSGTVICSVPDLCVEEGERLAVVGCNGSGKTTLLRVLAGLERDYGGACHRNVTQCECTYVHQTPYLFRGTVLQNVMYGLRARRESREKRERWAMVWLERMAMTNMAKRSVKHLSGGERRRVALARAMVLEPRLLLLDEPLADMDEAGKASVCEGLSELGQCTVVVASPSEARGGLTARTYRLTVPKA